MNAVTAAFVSFFYILIHDYFLIVPIDFKFFTYVLHRRHKLLIFYPQFFYFIRIIP